MDSEIVTTPGPWHLPSDKVTRASELIAQAKSITAVVGLAARRDADLPDGAIDNACWAVQDLLEQLLAITESKRPAKPASAAATTQDGVRHTEGTANPLAEALAACYTLSASDREVVERFMRASRTDGLDLEPDSVRRTSAGDLRAMWRLA